MSSYEAQKGLQQLNPRKALQEDKIVHPRIKVARRLLSTSLPTVIKKVLNITFFSAMQR